MELISTGKPVAQIAEELCIGSNLRSLRRENALLKAENDIFKKGRNYSRHQNPAQLRKVIADIHQTTGQGIRQIRAPSRVRRIMHERGLKALQSKTYVPRTSAGRADKP